MATNKPPTTTTSSPQPAARHFHVFGHNIAHSLSPALHNAGFAALGLPHHYSIHETPAVDASVQALITAPDFGGASVTFPHKLQIPRLLSSLAPSAARIGAVNTIVAKETPAGGEKVLVGENTDWAGIRACVARSAVGRGGGCGGATALVVGAGGAARAACYALQTLGVGEVAVVNRTGARGVEMAGRFEGVRFRVFGSLDEFVGARVEGVRVVVACVPADELGAERVPRGVFDGVEEGVLVEMAYRPPETGMMKVAAACKGWEVFRGTDVLEEQAYAQFELWTGEKAPVEAMREGMRAEVASRL